MTKSTRLELPVLLPGVPDAHDSCVGRLQALLGARAGIERSHLVLADSDAAGGQALICIHYDPDVLTLSRVEALARAAGAEVSARYGHAVFPVHAVGAEDAGRRVEAVLRALDGVLDVAANLAAQRVRVEWDRVRTDEAAIRTALDRHGYASASPTRGACCAPRPPAPEDASWLRRHRELALSLTAAVCLAIAWGGTRWFGWPRPLAIGLYLLAYGLGAFDLVRHWIGALRRGKLALDIDLLMLVAASGAAVLGEWAEGAFLLVLFSLAHALEHYATARARNAIRGLAELSPPTARVRRDGSLLDVPVEQVAAGEVVLVRPGERMPVDGQVTGGRSAVNQAPITGESVPAEKSPGDAVFAGTINGDGTLEIRTERVAGDRTLDRIVRLVEEAQTQKAPTQQFTERFERIFVPAVLIADVLLIVVPPLIGLWPWDIAFYRGMALLVAASPCALALGTPSAVLAGIAQAARHGVLIKGGAHLENLGTLRAMALDKTGTLTRGTPELTDAESLDGVATDELLAIAASVEAHSQHPLAAAIVRHAERVGVALRQTGELQSVTGRGVRSSLDGAPVEIGTLRLWEEPGITVPDGVRDRVHHLQAAGRSTVVVRHGERWLGVLGVVDRPRDGIRQVLVRLRALGIHPLVMLTGDNARVARAIAHEVGVDQVRPELLPEDKVTQVRELLQRHGQVAMVGDGVNDAPALAHATVGIAMGGAGTAVALETADVALMGDDLGKLPFAVGLSRRARAIIRQNLFIALGVLALLVLATATGVLGIGATVVLHEGSTLIVIGNALRLLTFDDT
ncbi:MAG: heavy metal translocating P-type ATPase [Gemmatimonadota bacterium]